MIGPALVLTVADHVFDDQKPIRKRSPYLMFIVGANGDETPFGEIEIEDMFAPESYLNHKVGEAKKENGLKSDDYIALILLKKTNR